MFLVVKQDWLYWHRHLFVLSPLFARKLWPIEVWSTFDLAKAPSRVVRWRGKKKGPLRCRRVFWKRWQGAISLGSFGVVVLLVLLLFDQTRMPQRFCFPNEKDEQYRFVSWNDVQKARHMQKRKKRKTQWSWHRAILGSSGLHALCLSPKMKKAGHGCATGWRWTSVTSITKKVKPSPVQRPELLQTVKTWLLFLEVNARLFA